MPTMEKLIRKVFSKFKKDELEDVINDLGEFTVEDLSLPNSLTKCPASQVANQVVALFKRKRLSTEEINQLDLIALHRHSSKRVWSVYKLTQINDDDMITTPSEEELNNLLGKELSLYYEVTVDISIRNHNGAYWIRISIDPDKGRNPVYIVHHPSTQYLMVTGMKAEYEDVIMQTFQTILSCSEAEKLSLTGRHLDSLAQMIINNNTEDETEFNLLETSTTKRKHPSEESDEEIECVVNEHEGLKRKRQSLLEHSFGNQPLPVLEKVDYKLVTKFRGLYAPKMAAEHEGPFKCSIRFEGTDVINGIKHLGKTGLADLPMKDHLRKIHKLGRNTFVLRSKEHSTIQHSQT